MIRDTDVASSRKNQHTFCPKHRRRLHVEHEETFLKQTRFIFLCFNPALAQVHSVAQRTPRGDA
jgi:hypothetical protein